jgi:outer membrane murein-binding lipoprotein Lpp
MMLLAIIMAAAIMGSILVFGCIIQGNDYKGEK